MFLNALKDVPEEPVSGNVYSHVHLRQYYNAIHMYLYTSMYAYVCMYACMHVFFYVFITNAPTNTNSSYTITKISWKNYNGVSKRVLQLCKRIHIY
jgi:hypothetical protein